MQISPPAATFTDVRRRGLTTPLVAAALLVAMMGLALILDRLWLEAARLELTTAAEASALAGARQLASDLRLAPEHDPQSLRDLAVQAAMMAAVQNRVAGETVVINEQDLHFPAPTILDADSSNATAEEPSAPETIIVSAHRTRFRGNPVALFIGELTGQPFGDAVGQAGASISSQVVGVRPLPGTVVPAIPLAIWRIDPTGQRTDTWQTAIEQRRGRDDYGYDEHSRSVTAGSDGIPELMLRTARLNGPATDANVQLVDIGTHFQDEELLRQFQLGWSPADLENWGGELRLATNNAGANGSSLQLEGLPQLEIADRDALDSILGEPRIALVYSTAAPAADGRTQSVDCVRLVAVRVLKVSDHSDGSCRITIQPTVIATRTALAGTPQAQDDPETIPVGTASHSTYIYRLQLTQ